MYKMYCVMCRDALKKMNGIKGKATSQAGHAFLHSFWDSENRFPDDAHAYKHSQQATKITVVVETEKELFEIMEYYKDICGISLVKDAGLTVFTEPTITCLGIGPIHVDKIGVNLKTLPLYK